MRFRVVIFDFDGTLVDTMEQYADKAGQLIERYYGLKRQEATALYWQTAGLAFKDQIESLFPGNPLNNGVVQEFERWKAGIIKGLVLGDKAKEVLKKLKQMGIITAVSSNNLEEYVREVFLRSDILPDLILGYRGDGFKKGEPHFRYVEDKTGIDRTRFLFVGDSPNDLILSTKAGVEFLALEGHSDKRDFQRIRPSVTTIKDIRQVLDYLI